MAILVIVNNVFESFEDDLVELFSKQDVPFLIVQNKTDIFPIDKIKSNTLAARLQVPLINFSCLKKDNTSLLHQEINKMMPRNALHFNSLIGDIIKKDDVVLLVTPIDSEAPVGRMILPQVQLIRDILDNHAVVVTLRETELEKYISKHQLLSQPLDNFLWQIALWTARGRVPKGTDLHKPILLLYWPNFTRLIVTPYALKISALWMENPCSLLETSQILAIPQRYVFTFFSAASTLKLAFVDRRLKSRISSRQASDQKPNAKRSLFQRFLARLRA